MEAKTMELRPHQLEAIEAFKTINEGIIHLPTGTGKTNIEAILISENIDNAKTWLSESGMLDEIPVFVILAPRIILCNQLFSKVKEILINKKQDCKYSVVHSGRTKENNNDLKLMKKMGMPLRDINPTTSYRVIIEEYDKARREKIPMIVFGTYDSAERIVDAGIPIYMLICDEGQYLVSNRFTWIAHEDEENPENDKQFNAHRKYYFTATLKETFSDNSIGMNNTRLFGPIIYSKTPLEMINAGEMIRPRMHLVDIEENNSEDNINKDVNAIISAFVAHKGECKTSPKLLVVAKNSEDLNDIISHPKMRRFRNSRPNLKVFDISSRWQPRMNEEKISREEFLKTIKGLSDSDEALILHIDILSEGIDVPGITGIMPMNMMGIGKFLQTLGRASRLHDIDRTQIYAKTLDPKNEEEFIKYYAWIIIPKYGIIGEDLKEQIETWIRALRGHGFNASEDIVVKTGGVIKKTEEDGFLTKKEERKLIIDQIIDIENIIENKEEANRLEVEDFRLKENIRNMSDEELIKFD